MKSEAKMTFMKWITLLPLVLLASCFKPGSSQIIETYKKEFPLTENQDAMSFMYEDFGGLSLTTLQTNALPWKLLQTSLVIHANEVEKKNLPLAPASVEKILSQFGFIFPDEVLNWNEHEPLFRKPGNPIGITTGLMKGTETKTSRLEIEVANITCSACHTGRTYDQDGNATNTAHLGRPNTSLNVDNFTRTVVKAIGYAMNNQDKSVVLAAMKTIFPETSSREITAYKTAWSFIKSQINKLISKYDAATPFSHGGPGLSNGLGSLKIMLKSETFKEFDHSEVAFVSIPDLSQRKFKTALLIDGSYTHIKRSNRFEALTSDTIPEQNLDQLSEIAAFFLVPIMGLKPAQVPQTFPKFKAIMSYLDQYEFQPFPGKINREKAAAGAKIFQRNCSGCHGTYSNDEKPQLISYPNRLIDLKVVGTDIYRANFDHAEETIGNMKKTVMGKTVNGAVATGYVAPILNGVWASAPYLHNASVPTLWHLLNPQLRPKKFEVGGHKLDFEKMGVEGEMVDGVYRFKPGYQSFTPSVVYDTSENGRSNKGHEFASGKLSDQEKMEVIEFLKLL